MAYENAYVIKNLATITFDGVDVKDQLSQCALAGDTPTYTNRMYGGVDKDRDITSWTVTISGYSFRGTGGVAKLIDDAVAANEVITVVFTPKSGTGMDIVTFDFLPVPVGFGGAVGDWNTFEQEFEVIDQPVYTSAA